MNEPKRWSEAGSDIDPVLRSVVRYGQGLGPDEAALQRLLRAATRPAPVRPRVFRRFAVSVALGMAAAFGGAAWASNLNGWFRSPPQRSLQAPPPRAPAPAAHPGASILQHAVPAPSASEAAPVVVAPPPRVASALPSAAPVVDESELLQRARSVLSSEPVRALALTGEHAKQFPRSALSEERQALRVEALARLGRRAEAERALEVFEASFPRSPYRRRLRSLVSP